MNCHSCLCCAGLTIIHILLTPSMPYNCLSTWLLVFPWLVYFEPFPPIFPIFAVCFPSCLNFFGRSSLLLEKWYMMLYWLMDCGQLIKLPIRSKKN